MATTVFPVYGWWVALGPALRFVEDAVAGTARACLVAKGEEGYRLLLCFVASEEAAPAAVYDEATMTAVLWSTLDELPVYLDLFRNHARLYVSVDGADPSAARIQTTTPGDTEGVLR